MHVTIVNPAWKVCPPQVREYYAKKNSFRLITSDEHARGVENKQRVLEVLRKVFSGSGLNILLYGSQNYNPENGEDFDLMAFYASRASLKAIRHVYNLEDMPPPVSRVLKAVLEDNPSALLDFLEKQFTSFRFKLQVADSMQSLNVFYQPVLERVAGERFSEEYRKIRILHPQGPLTVKCTQLFDGTPLWIPTNTRPAQFDGEKYWLREYYGWLYEPGFKAPSALPKGIVGNLITSEIVLQERDDAEKAVKVAEKTFAAAITAYERERNVAVDPCNAFVRVNRFSPEFKEAIRARIRRHAPTEAEIAAFTHQVEARSQALDLQT